MDIRLQIANGKAARALIFVMVVVAAALVFALYVAYKIRPLRPGTMKHMIVTGEIGEVKTQLALYKSYTGSYPTTQQGLAALVSKPTLPPFPSKWFALLSRVPKDPWGSDYVYLCPGQAYPDAYDLYSPGPDRTPNTADDDWGR
jgi:general secretion pathway protein G